jgi:EAL domain-containing protein (putative c-di-GMP-specific phosphodiesterase class I)
VARIAGDQFALLMGSLAGDEAQALTLSRDLGEQIQRAIEVPVPLERGEGLKPSGSLGIFLFDGSENSQEMILSRAEIALQHAKEGGRGQLRFYSPELQSEAEIRTSMEAGLRLAIERGELSLNLQGQYRADGRLIGAEALLRWQHDGNAVSPAQFIPLAESTGLIVPIGRWVIEQACALLQRWQSDDKTRELTLAVNISARQFQQPDFPSHLRETLESSGVNPERLKLELTESVVFGDRDLARRRMREIRGLGVRLSMDDFGTGFSSLSYLQYLPFDQLKIDQSFIAGMTRGDSNLAIVRAILALGKALKLNIIAEGVESCQQLDLLLKEGCDSFQGYLFDRPQPSDQWQPRPARAALERCKTSG